MTGVVNRAVVTVAEAATDFVQGMTATDFAITHQDDVAIDSHLAVEIIFLFGVVAILLTDWEDWQFEVILPRGFLGAKKKKKSAEGCH